MAIVRSSSHRIAVCTLGLGLMLGSPSLASAGKPACEYTVKKGDTLSAIARRNGVTEKNLLAANPALAKNPNRLRVGQTLELCKAKNLQSSRPQSCGEGGAFVSHKVGKGETLGAIAARYSVTRDSIRKYNPRLETRANDMIRAGETLRVCSTHRRDTHRAWLVDGIQLQPGEGYNVRRPDNAWGTPTAIAGIETSLATYRSLEPEAPLVQIGDVSRKKGGPLRSHLSHQDGRDVDIGYVFETDAEGKSRSLDIARSWALVRSFADNEDVSVIFVDYRIQQQLYEHAQSSGVDQAQLDRIFEYPRKGDGEAILYHWRGHTRHFHVRFKPTRAKAPEQS